MDPSIMKLLEEDEDENMHSGADVEAFTAALNRDIGGDTSSTSLPSDVHANGNNHIMYSQWQTSSQDGNNEDKSQQEPQTQSQQDFKHNEQPENLPSDVHARQHVPGGDSQAQDVNTSSQSSNEMSLQHNQSQQNTQEQISDLPKSSSAIQMQDPNRLNNPSSNAQFQNNPANQQKTAPEQANNPATRGKQIPFGSLLPIILPELDKDRAMQLTTLYNKLKKNEIPKDGFIRLMRNIVGDQMLRLAVVKMQSKGPRNSQMAHSQLQMHSQVPVQQPQIRPPPGSTAQYSDPYSFAQLHQRGQNAATEPSSGHPPATQVQKDGGQRSIDNNPKQSRDAEHVTDARGMQVGQMAERPAISIQGLSRQQQQHLHFSQSSYPMYGSGNYYPYSGTNVSTSAAMVKPQQHDPQMRQQSHPSFGSTPVSGTTQTMSAMSMPKFERQSSFGEPRRAPGGPMPHMPNNSTVQQTSFPSQASMGREQKGGAVSSVPFPKQEPVDEQPLKPFSASHGHGHGPTAFSASQGSAPPSSSDAFPNSTSAQPNSVSTSMAIPMDVEVQSSQPSSTAPVGGGNNAKAPPKKPSAGQKKPLDNLGSSPPLPSKKQKVSGGFLDQSIEHLNDVTAVSGVNLREEEEQLFSGSKDENRASETSRRVVQEEEDGVILHKNPLQRKLAEIMAKNGLKNLSNDVERCLSLCVEERLRGLVSNLIRISKQRADSERTRHRTIITSDVREQIMEINRKAREEWEKKQAEAERLRKGNDPDGAAGADSDKEKDEHRGKSLKGNKDEDDKMRTTAANVAARAAVGGDDMLSKWQLMAEQARQKREGGSDAGSSMLTGKDVGAKPSSNAMKNSRDNQGSGRKDQPAGSAFGSRRQFGRNQSMTFPSRPARTISVKDVIAVLEKEPQMTKSTTLFRLYEKVRSVDTKVATE